MGSAKILMDKKTWLPAVISVLLAAGMVAAAEITGEREIIFPEITAIAIGALAAPKQVWNTSKLRLFAAVALSAGTGAAIVRLLPLPVWVQAPLGIFCAAGYITLLGCGFVPAISACVLPILMQTGGAAYLISALGMTALILGVQTILERFGLREKCGFIPEARTRGLIKLRAKQSLTAAAICLLPAYFGEIFITAPPLIVAFFELSKPNSKPRGRIWQTVLLIGGAAFIGTIMRAALSVGAGLPMAFSAAVACGAVLWLVDRLGLYFPPCGAIATLPFLIDQSALWKLPLEVLGGYLIFCAAVVVLFREKT